jgi:NADH-quinone oxidoreductase subunit N
LVTLLTAAAAISLAVGSLSAMRQVKLKRLIAFSAVANAGWFLLGLTSGQWQLSIIHLMVYTLLSINLFSVFILPLFRNHPSLEYNSRILKAGPGSKTDMVDHGADGGSIKYISDLHQIYKINPSLALALTLSMFSLAGIPPLAGFYSKYLLINAVTQSEQYLLLSLALGVAVLSAFYYLRVIKTIYFASAGPSQSSLWWFSVDPLHINALLTSLTAGLTLVFFIKPDYFCIWLALM